MSRKSDYRDGDSFTKRSRKEGYRSRSSYKLKEILEKQIKLSKGHSVLDLGSYPGGWSQVAMEKVGKEGKVAAIDIQPMNPIENCFFLKKSIKDIEKKDFNEIKEYLPFDLVLSDMAPNISGIRDRDDSMMIGLVDSVLFVVDNLLDTNGSVLIKVFQGESLDYTSQALKTRFKKVKIFKPKASRANSNETYIIGKEIKIK